jgi:hypothetical protein
MVVAVGVTCVAISIAAHASPYDYTRSDEFINLERRALTSRPQRLDGPLRTDNVTDEEVREIQQAASEILPKQLVNISGVTSGCRCEDGPTCKAYAWVTAFYQGRPQALQLALIGQHWAIGPVQRWWLQHDQLELQLRKEKDWLKSEQARNDLILKFPNCPQVKSGAQPINTARSSPIPDDLAAFIFLNLIEDAPANAVYCPAIAGQTLAPELLRQLQSINPAFVPPTECARIIDVRRGSYHVPTHRKAYLITIKQFDMLAPNHARVKLEQYHHGKWALYETVEPTKGNGTWAVQRITDREMA